MVWTCPGCKENKDNPVITDCEHCICEDCAEEYGCTICEDGSTSWEPYGELRNILQGEESPFLKAKGFISLKGHPVAISEIRDINIESQGTPDCCDKSFLHVSFRNGDKCSYKESEFDVEEARHIIEKYK